MLNKEEVTEKEGKDFADSINGVFRLTSAANNFGISDLFEELCERYCLMGKNTKKDGFIHLFFI